jgi:hypothetical protein
MLVDGVVMVSVLRWQARPRDGCALTTLIVMIPQSNFEFNGEITFRAGNTTENQRKYVSRMKASWLLAKDTYIDNSEE